MLAALACEKRWSFYEQAPTRQAVFSSIAKTAEQHYAVEHARTAYHTTCETEYQVSTTTSYESRIREHDILYEIRVEQACPMHHAACKAYE